MMNFTLRSAVIAASSLVLLGTLPAQAGADAVRAEAYFNAISGGNADTIASFYADDAEFHWIGGPLDGKYKGKDKIKGVWEKFSQAAGKLDHKVLQLSESANGKTSTVTARVMFKAESEVPVKFIMVYKDGKIASEVWQVDRSGAVEAKAESKPETNPAPAAASTPAPAAPNASTGTGSEPQSEAANAPAANAPAQAPQAQDTTAAEATAPAAGAAPAGAEKQAATAPETNPNTEAKPAGEPKGKYAGSKKGGYAGKNNGYGYERKAYRPKKPYYGHDGYGHGYGHRHGGYGWHGGYGYGGYGRGYGHY